MPDYWISDQVRYRQIDGLGIVLDLRGQRYSVLDAAATEAFAALSGETQAEAMIQRWVADHEVSVEDARAALTDFAADCLGKGWLSDTPPSAAAWQMPRFAMRAGLMPRMPRSLVAFWALAATSLSLKFRGFRKTYRPHPAAATGAASRADKSDLDHAARAFVFAENFIFFRRGANDCLVRSLALYRYLCRIGIPATHVIFVRNAPFAAHAAVEVNGQGVLAPAPRGYFRLASLAPMGG